MPENRARRTRVGGQAAHVIALLAALLLGLMAGAGPTRAATLDRAAVESYFPKPYIVGERDATLPVWPIFKQNATSDELIAYVFESIDFEPIPGFSGTPVNLLVAIKPSGAFLDVAVLSQHEPVFLDGLGPEPLIEFLKQYAGKSLRQSIKIVAKGTRDPRADGVAAEIDGVAKATASVRIINETIINSALQVARARLGFSKGRDPNRSARAKPDVFESLTFKQMLERNYIRHLRLTNAEVEKQFAGTVAEGLDAAALADPKSAFVDIYLAEVDVPIIGRNLLGEAHWRKLMDQLDGAPAMLVLASGRWTFMPEDFVPGSTPNLIALDQAEAPVAWRDFVWRDTLDIEGPPAGDVAILRIAPQAAFDPASPSELAIRVMREKGQIYPERVTRDFKLAYELPQSLFDLPPSDDGKGLRSIWASRQRDIAILAVGLLVLAVALSRQKALVRSPKNFRRFRLAYLAFTLIFIGWLAQAQLSIVWLFGLVKALKGEGGFVFFLYDPPTLIIAVFALAALFVWGRGTFCGWLCPFGALQEFAGELAKLLGLRQFGLPQRYEALSRLPKFAVLAVILGVAVFFSNWAETAAEVEPFKTSITLVFLRATPFVLYAVLLLIAGMFHYKFFCRYLCPLGAMLAALSFLRRWDWLKRRKECGSPCQLCKVKCRYGAIEKSGAITYSECFQCMDCVVIHDDVTQCVPLVLQRKQAERAEKRAPQMEAAQ